MRISITGEFTDVGMALGYVECWATHIESVGGDGAGPRAVGVRLMETARLEQPVDIPVSRFIPDSRTVSGVDAAFREFFSGIDDMGWIDDLHYTYTGKQLKRLRDNLLRSIGSIRH